MGNRKIILTLLVLIFSVCSILLITGSGWLLIPVIKDPYLPLGTFVTWAVFITLPLSIYLGFEMVQKPVRSLHRWIGYALLALIVLGCLWVPICYGLAGNLSFSFSEKTTFQGGQTAMKIFWYLNGTLAILPILILAILAIFGRGNSQTFS